MTVGAASVVQEHFARSIAATTRFFEAEAPAVAECCRQMAERFSKGGTLIAMGHGAQESDAQHVAVEFVHPVIVGKRALPAIAVTSERVSGLATPGDIALAICVLGIEPSVRAAMAGARDRGLLTVLITNTAGDSERIADIELRIGEPNPLVAQEVSETLYHVLWELVHVFFESDDARQLYSYLPQAAGARDHDELIAEVKASALQKARDVSALRATMQDACAARIAAAGRAVASRLRMNGKLLAFGNGGSATDAQDVAADCLDPPIAGWHHLAALALTNDVGVVTAIGNDVGFEHVFSRQIIAFGGATDIALGFSTSGASRNVAAAMTEAKARGLMTIGMSGGDGGQLARSQAVDFCFTAGSDHIPRIQEAHATVWHALLSVVQEELRT